MNDILTPCCPRQPELACIVAAGADNAIGRNGIMPWHLPEDLKHFKETTMGAPVIMGRKTWLSLPKAPLPGRLNIVLSRNPDFNPERALLSDSPQKAIELAGNMKTAFVIGGETIYRTFLPYCRKIYLTRIDMLTPDADTRFPELLPEEWQVCDRSGKLTSRTGLNYEFLVYERRNNK